MNSKASNVASKAELGRYPLMIVVGKMILKYIHNIMLSPSTSILRQTFQISKELYNQGKSSYYSNVIKFVNLFGNSSSTSLEEVITVRFINEFSKNMQYQYREYAKQVIQSSRKLIFYSNIKENYEQEQYLDHIQNITHRKQFTKFRISNHRLFVETGRYTNIQYEKRICSLCQLQEIEDEKHI